MIIFHKVRNIHTAIIMILFFQFSWNTLTFYTSRVRVCVPHYFCLFAAGLANCPLFYNTFTCSSPVSFWHATFPISKCLYAAALLRVTPSGQAPYSTFSFYHHHHHKHQELDQFFPFRLQSYKFSLQCYFGLPIVLLPCGL